MDHLRIIQQSGHLFLDKCSRCLKNAKTVARVYLVLDGGTLMGRYTGQVMTDFLSHHGSLNADEVDKMVVVLERQLLTDVHTWDQ